MRACSIAKPLLGAGASSHRSHLLTLAALAGPGFWPSSVPSGFRGGITGDRGAFARDSILELQWTRALKGDAPAPVLDGPLGVLWAGFRGAY